MTRPAGRWRSCSPPPLRYNLNLSRVRLGRLAVAIPLAVAAGLLAGLFFGLYRRRWAYGSFEEVSALLRSTVLATIVLFLLNAPIHPPLVPRSAPLATGMAGLILMAGGRNGAGP